MRANYCLTLAASTNATASQILLPFFPGNSRKPLFWALDSNCEKIKLVSTNTHDKNTWMDGKVFEKCLDFWYCEVLKVASSTICLILDNCAAQDEALTELNGLEKFFLH